MDIDGKTYRTAEIAALIGVHPNTVRFYEEEGLLPQVPRLENGYRVYSERHLIQLRLIRTAFRAEILSARLRDEAINIVKTSVTSDFKSTVQNILTYRNHIKEEIGRAREAIALTKQILDGDASKAVETSVVGRREAAAQTGVSAHVLRDWERNGLIQIPRAGNRRQYGSPELNRLKIIAVLRHANYSQMAIRRMLGKLDRGEVDLLSAIDTPERTEDIISVADRYITSLTGALRDTEELLRYVEKCAFDGFIR